MWRGRTPTSSDAAGVWGPYLPDRKRALARGGTTADAGGALSTARRGGRPEPLPGRTTFRYYSPYYSLGHLESENERTPGRLTWGFVVELRGIEPLTSSMPCMIRMSAGVSGCVWMSSSTLISCVWLCPGVSRYVAP